MIHLASGPGTSSGEPRRASAAGVLVVLVALAGVLVWPGCDDEDDCPPFDDVDVAGRDTNPDGVPYPAEPWGGTTGSIIPNFTFRGYINADRDAGLQTLSLADLYDPGATHHKVLHLMMAVMWCPHCNAQTGQMVQTVPTLQGEGAVFVQTLADGPERDSAPTLCDFDAWVDKHHINFTLVFDTDARRIGSVATISSVPWNALIDTRTMEIISVAMGSPSDFAAYVRSGLQWVDDHPL